jgi:energy-coupling factor transporter ATP-binding protein EcfA2
LVDLLLARSETLIVATHDLELARRLCGRAVVLGEGRVQWDGALPRLMDSPEALERYGLAG